MSIIQTANPMTGETSSTHLQECSLDDVRAVCRRAEKLFADKLPGRGARASALRAIAARFEHEKTAVVETAERETALARPRLEGELARVCFQLRLFAEVVEEGSYLEATIDHAGETAMGPRPDLRRLLVALGPVAVFGASNFPLAFSVPGGDTVSALAAGCPVVVKAHSAHPLTSDLCASIMRAGLVEGGVDPDFLQVVYGFESGRALVVDPAVTAVSFTGSLTGGKALMELIATREQPIPFFGELSGLNPAIVTPGAVAHRSSEVAAGIAGAVTGSGGQLCTKPGLVLLPRGEGGDQLVAGLREHVDVPPTPLLSQRIADSYRQRLTEIDGVATVSGEPGTETCLVGPTIVEAPEGSVPPLLWEETFGPTTTVVRYDDSAHLVRLLGDAPASLAVSIHHAETEEDLVCVVSSAVERRAGRVVFNQQTTGLAVTWAQHHGGPWPSTNTQHTSVGPTAIRRFLRPVAWQNAPVAVLPPELRDEAAGLPRRIDGELVVV